MSLEDDACESPRCLRPRANEAGYCCFGCASHSRFGRTLLHGEDCEAANPDAPESEPAVGPMNSGKIRALLSEATPGPWYVMPNDLVGGWCVRDRNTRPSESAQGTVADFVRREDAELIAAARNQLPALVDRVLDGEPKTSREPCDEEVDRVLNAMGVPAADESQNLGVQMDIYRLEDTIRRVWPYIAEQIEKGGL